MIIAHDDPCLSWHGHISLETTREYTRPWRILFVEKEMFFPELSVRAAEPSGVRIAFHTTTRKISGGILLHEEPRFLDLCVNGNFLSRQALKNRETFLFRNLPSGEKLIELWLPQKGDFALRWLELDAGTPIRAFDDTRKRWITYGSSITQCRGAISPTQTWPALVAREENLNLTNLGLSGQCHLDPLMALILREISADFISVCAGINVYADGSLNARTFASGLIGFVRIVREKHPETPLAIISPIISPSRENLANVAGWTLRQYREAVLGSVETLRKLGDQRIFSVDGTELFGENLLRLMPDGLHPDAEGYRLLGQNFLRNVAPSLFRETPISPSLP